MKKSLLVALALGALLPVAAFAQVPTGNVRVENNLREFSGNSAALANLHGTPNNAKALMGVNLTAANTEANLEVLTTANGSGTNGPTTAKNGIYINAQKNGWFDYPPDATVGEVDPFQILGRQGTGAGCTQTTLAFCSDMSGMLINVQNTGLGFLSATEMTSSIVDNNPSSPTFNTITHAIDMQEAALNGLTGTYDGVVYNSTHGESTTGLVIQATGAGASWDNFIKAANHTGGATFVVDGSGNLTAASLTTAGAATAGTLHSAGLAVTGGTMSGVAISSGSIAGSTAFPNPITLGTINGPAGVATATMATLGCYHIVGGGANYPTATATSPPAGGSTAGIAVASMSATCLASGTNIFAGGTGYTVGDILTVVGGTFSTASRVHVLTVDGGGGVLTYSATTAGIYTVLPVEPVSVTGGTGSGAQLQNLGYAPNTLTVTAAGSGYLATPTVSFASTAQAVGYTGTSTASTTLAPAGQIAVTGSGTTLGTVGANGTAVTALGALINGSGVRQTLTGTAYTVPANTSLVRLTQTGTIATQTITLPTPLGDGQAIQFDNYAGVITALTFSPAVNGWTNATTLNANIGIRIRWDATEAAWQREE